MDQNICFQLGPIKACTDIHCQNFFAGKDSMSQLLSPSLKVFVHYLFLDIQVLAAFQLRSHRKYVPIPAKYMHYSQVKMIETMVYYNR